MFNNAAPNAFPGAMGMGGLNMPGGGGFGFGDGQQQQQQQQQGQPNQQGGQMGTMTPQQMSFMANMGSMGMGGMGQQGGGAGMGGFDASQAGASNQNGFNPALLAMLQQQQQQQQQQQGGAAASQMSQSGQQPNTMAYAQSINPHFFNQFQQQQQNQQQPQQQQQSNPGMSAGGFNPALFNGGQGQGQQQQQQLQAQMHQPQQQSQPNMFDLSQQQQQSQPGPSGGANMFGMGGASFGAMPGFDPSQPQQLNGNAMGMGQQPQAGILGMQQQLQQQMQALQQQQQPQQVPPQPFQASTPFAAASPAMGSPAMTANGSDSAKEAAAAVAGKKPPPLQPVKRKREGQPSASPSLSQAATYGGMHGSPAIAGTPRASMHAALERDRSHTRSPSVSSAIGGPRPPGTPVQHQQLPGQPQPRPQQQQQQQQPPAQAGVPMSGVPPGWQPSLNPATQQHLLGQALQVSKARASQGQAVNPAQILMSMGFVYVKAASLPPGVVGGGITGGGAVLSVQEAKMLGLINPQAQFQPGQPQAGQQPQPPQQQQQQQQLLAQQQLAQQQALQRNMAMQQGGSTGPGTPQQAPQIPLQPKPQQPQPSTPQQAHTMAPPQQYRPSPSAMPPPQPTSSPGFGQPGQQPGMRSSPAGPSGNTMQYPRSRQPSVALSASGRPVSRGGAGSRSGTRDGPAQQQQLQPGPQGGPPPFGSPDGMRRPSHAGGPINGVSKMEAGTEGDAPAPVAAAPVPPVAPAPDLPPVLGGRLPKVAKSGSDVADFNTRLTPLPPSDGSNEDRKKLAELWKPMTDKEESELLDIMKKDSAYAAAMNQHARRTTETLRAKMDELRPSARSKALHWWERAGDEDTSILGKAGGMQPFRVLLPRQKREETERKGGRSALWRETGRTQLDDRRACRAAALREEDLVPIRLEIDHENWRFKDTFTWNAADTHVGLDLFAHTLCDDFGLPSSIFVPLIRESIQTQLAEHASTAALRHRPKAPQQGRESTGRGTLSELDEKWWAKWRAKVEEEEEKLFGAPSSSPSRKRRKLNGHGEESWSGDEGEEAAAVQANGAPQNDMRLQIKLDITVGAMNLVDQFEWDISEETSSPEHFAEVFCADLGLAGEFRTAIAHSIREQIDVHVRSLTLVGHGFDGSVILDEELRGAFLPALSAIARTEQDAELHTPKLLQLSEAEIDRLEKERERESRRKRRQTRGRRGVNLPERDPQKTRRTPAVFGLQAAQANSADASGGAFAFLDSSSRSLAGMSTRRAAAAAANAHIAPHSAVTSDFEIMSSGGDGRSGAAGPSAAAARARLERHSTHFTFPGGYGSSSEESRGPKFTPGNVGADSRRAKSPDGTGKDGASGAASTGHTSTKAAMLNTIKNQVRPEDLLNQHPNLHDGQWYCSNCGVPGLLATGRRKGPLGDKSLCGPCGKYYHRHRKIPTMNYTRDLAYHQRQRGEVPVAAAPAPPAPAPLPVHVESDHDGGASKEPALDLGGLADVSVPTTGEPNDDKPLLDVTDDVLEQFTMFEESRGDANGHGGSGPGSGLAGFPSRSQTRATSPDDLPFFQVGSPDNSDSEGEAPMPAAAPAQAGSPAKGNKLSSSSSATLGVSPSARGASPMKRDASSASLVAPPSSIKATSGSPAASVPPPWLQQAASSLRAKYPDDRFELKPKNAAAAAGSAVPWGVRCLDCPGKLYTPGPAESLQNFEVHLKNRAHRANVSTRLEK